MEASAERIEREIATLAGEPFTEADTPGVTRHAYTRAYANTVEHFAAQLRELGYTTWYDPVGTLVADSDPQAERVFGIGSHCDSVRCGGAYDGTMGMVCALEVCRLAHARGLELPLRVIAFLEEEGSGFGQLLLGSRIAAQAVTDEELASLVDEHGVSFPDAARAAGYEPERHREAAAVLDGLAGWIEMHIEQGPLLESENARLGIVDGIAGYIHADLEISGRRGHAGATPMTLRADAGVVAAEVIVEAERMARARSADTVATVGQLKFDPGVINVIPGVATLSLDVRSLSGDHVSLQSEIVAFAQERAHARGASVEYRERQRSDPTWLDPAVVAALERSAAQTDARVLRMHSAAAHDTMMVARRAPAAMVFVPCEGGISHAPEERADPADAALAADVILAAIQDLMAR